MTQNDWYLQDKRQMVGNDMMWWAKDGKGYTTDLNKAHVFTKQEAFEHAKHRDSDVPWPKNYIDSISRPAVDFQYADREIALMGVRDDSE